MTAESPGAHSVAIIGAGFAGIGMAIQLKKAGVDSFVMFERANDVGGTWRDNTYPGAACDVPSHVYSLSFEPKADWSRAYAESEEIHAYLLSLVEKWQLRQHLQLGTEIVEACFNDDEGFWTLTTGVGAEHRARVIVACVGGLVDPAYPDIEGIDSFSGAMFHTARWNHDYVLEGKKVAVIGTGASAVQVVPSIASQVEHLSVFQRTPAWVMPKPDKEYSAAEKDFYTRNPFALRLSRSFKYWLSEIFGPMVFLDSRILSTIAQAGSLRHLRASVSDPSLRKKLTPRFQFGCKRVLISNDYWAAFERENVSLVTDPIKEIRGEGIRCSNGSVHELDAIIFATGFALGLAAAPFPVVGRGGRTLNEAWQNGAVAYKGMTVSGFPNWFTMMGPNTGPGHTSVLVYTEAQISHAMQAIKSIIAEDWKFVDVKQDVQDAYNEGIQGRMKYMVWSTSCNPWYLSEDGKNHSLYPGFAAEYVLRAKDFHQSDYEIVRR